MASGRRAAWAACVPVCGCHRLMLDAASCIFFNLEANATLIRIELILLLGREEALWMM